MAEKKSALKQEEKRVKGLLAVAQVVQKFLAKEFIWNMTVLVLSFPLSLILLFILDVADPALAVAVEESTAVDVVDLFLLMYVLSVGGLYGGRLLVQSLRTLAKKD